MSIANYDTGQNYGFEPAEDLGGDQYFEQALSELSAQRDIFISMDMPAPHAVISREDADRYYKSVIEWDMITEFLVRERDEGDESVRDAAHRAVEEAGEFEETIVLPWRNLLRGIDNEQYTTDSVFENGMARSGVRSTYPGLKAAIENYYVDELRPMGHIQRW